MTQIEMHEHAIVCLKDIEKNIRQIEDFNIRLTNERAKPLIMSFLLANESWYLQQIESCKKEITRLEQDLAMLSCRTTNFQTKQ